MSEADYQFTRCPETYALSLEEEPRCAVYAGHLEEHETEPLPPALEDKSDGVHIIYWRVAENGDPVDVRQERIDVASADESADG